MRKKASGMWLAILALLLCFVFPVGAEETGHSGTCGKNATWQFDAGTQTLTISGTGPMADVNESIWAWVDYKAEIRHLVVEEGVTAIGKNAFNYLDDLRSAKIADSVKRIEESAFSGCWRMQSIQLSNTLQYIGKSAFRNCSGLTNFVMPDSVTECGPDVFNSCTGLTSITLSQGLETLPLMLLDNCSELKSITIPASVKKVENWGPGWGNALNAIIFKGDAPKFSQYAFEEITATVRYPANNGTWTEDVQKNYGGNITWVPDGDVTLSGTFGYNTKMSWKLEKGTLTITGNGHMSGWTSSENPNPPWYPYRGLIKKVVFSGKIENIYTRALAGCTELTDVVWVPSIISVNNGAFSGCTSLKEITIPDTVKYMNEGVFSGCTSLRSVKLSSSLEELSASIFRRCTSLKSVTVPASINNLWRWIFAESAVETVYFQGNMPGFQGDPFTQMEATLYYAANNRTWTADKIKAEESKYGGKIKFVATEELNQYTQNQQFVEDSKPNTPDISGGKNPGSNTVTNNPAGNSGSIGGNGGSGADVVPETTETQQQTTAPTESIGGDPTETTNPVEQTDVPTESTDSEDVDTSQKENAGAWIVWLAVGIFVVADTVVGIIYLKKRKNRKE